MLLSDRGWTRGPIVLPFCSWALPGWACSLTPYPGAGAGLNKALLGCGQTWVLASADPPLVASPTSFLEASHSLPAALGVEALLVAQLLPAYLGPGYSPDKLARLDPPSGVRICFPIIRGLWEPTRRGGNVS